MRARALTVGLQLLSSVWPNGRQSPYTPIDASFDSRNTTQRRPAPRATDFDITDDTATLILPGLSEVPARETRMVAVFLALHIQRAREACLALIQARWLASQRAWTVRMVSSRTEASTVLRQLCTDLWKPHGNLSSWTWGEKASVGPVLGLLAVRYRGDPAYRSALDARRLYDTPFGRVETACWELLRHLRRRPHSRPVSRHSL